MASVTEQPKNGEYYGIQSPGNLKQTGTVPSGLEYLQQLDQVLIKQQVELLEVLTGFETQNRYVVQNSMGQQIMYVQEESGCCERQCCGPNRGFQMHVTDNTNQEIMRLWRECACSCCWCIPCCDSCASELVVEAPPGNIIGFIKQEGYFWKLKVGIYDDTHNRIGVINGPCCPCTCCCCPRDIDFPITSSDGTVRMGNIAKQWAGCVKESFTNADNFSVNFPLDIDVKVKALMFAAAYMVEFLEFEYQNNSDS